MTRKNKQILIYGVTFSFIVFIGIILVTNNLYQDVGENRFDNFISNTRQMNDSTRFDFVNSQNRRDEIVKRINYLNWSLCRPSETEKDSELIMQNPEWALFSYAYTTYALTNIIKLDQSLSTQYLPMMRMLIENSLQMSLSSKFGVENIYSMSSTHPDYSVLYLGHINLMIGSYRSVSKDTTFNAVNDTISKLLYVEFNKSDCKNLESYPTHIWIPDNTVALASLELHSKNTKSNYNIVCKQWEKLVREKYTDENTGVLYSTIDSQTGLPLEEPRGSMLGWDIIYISKYNKEYAIELYNNFYSNFSDNLIKVRLFKERFGNSNTEVGDVDSGPTFYGYSIPANVFAMPCAIIAKDYKTAGQIETLINFGGRIVENKNEIYYDTRLIDMEISPMAEAIILFAITIEGWTVE